MNLLMVLTLAMICFCLHIYIDAVKHHNTQALLFPVRCLSFLLILLIVSGLKRRI